MAKEININPAYQGLSKFNYSFGQVRSIPENVEETRTIDFVISSEQRDRYNTVLLLANWELANYKKNPVVGFNHPFFSWSTMVQMNPDYTIGTGKVSKDKENKLLLGSVTFEPKELNELAEKVFRKIIHGTYKSTSVGFYETKEGSFGEGDEARGEKDETYYYGGQDLLEFSIVEIPANTDATVRSFLADVEKNCPSFVANELSRLRNHAQQGTRQANEAAAEFVGNIEHELDLMSMELQMDKL